MDRPYTVPNLSKKAYRPDGGISFLQQLEIFTNYANNQRCPIRLKGYTPEDFIQGKVPDKNRFKSETEKARKQRVKI